MKLLGIMGSSRRDGNTNDLLDVALQAAAQGGAEVEKIILVDYSIHHIYNCKDCKNNPAGCPPDDFPSIRDRIFEANGLIWASPLYWYSVSGLIKVLLDRLSCIMYREGNDYFRAKMGGKFAAVIVTQEEPDLSQAQHLLGTMKMVFDYPDCHWQDLGSVVGLGGSRGTAIKDEKLVAAASALGKKFTQL